MKRRSNKLAGVFLFRPGENFFRGAGFHNDPVLHDNDIVAEGPDHLEVVADENIGEVESLLKAFEQLQDLELDGPVQGGGGFVQDHEFRFQDQCPGDGDPLVLAA